MSVPPKIENETPSSLNSEQTERKGVAPEATGSPAEGEAGGSPRGIWRRMYKFVTNQFGDEQHELSCRSRIYRQAAQLLSNKLHLHELEMLAAILHLAEDNAEDRGKLWLISAPRAKQTVDSFDGSTERIKRCCRLFRVIYVVRDARSGSENVELYISGFSDDNVTKLSSTQEIDWAYLPDEVREDYIKKGITQVKYTILPRDMEQA